MNGAAFFSQSPILEPLGWVLIHFLWQGAALALLLAAALSGLKAASAQSRYLAGCLVMLLMGVAPLITLRYEVQRAKPIVTARSLQPLEEVPIRKDPSQSAQPVGTITSSNGEGVLAVRSPAAVTDRIIPWFITIWCFGVLFLSARLFASWCRIQLWKCSHREALDSVWLAKLNELQARLGMRKKIALLKTSFLETPAVIGWLRPVILVPASALSGLTPAQLEAILIHELSHIRRHDYLVNLLQSAVETLLFYHPAVWWVSSKIRQERENCCDDIAVQLCGDRCNYARALTTLEQLRCGTPALALAADGGSIGDRVRRILGIRKVARFNSTWTGGALGFMALVTLVYVSRVILFAEEPQRQPVAIPSPNDTKSVVKPIQDSEPAKSRVVLDYPVDWTLIRSNLKNFISDIDAPLALQLHQYFASRGINVSLEKKGEERGANSHPDTVLIPAQINETSQTLKVSVAHPEKAFFEEALRRLASPFDRILIETKWAELGESKPFTSGLRHLLPQLLTGKKGQSSAESIAETNLNIKPCLGSAVAIQAIGNERQTNSLAIKGSEPFTAILSQMQLVDLIQTLEKRGGVDILTTPRLETEIGRPARISIEDALAIQLGTESNSEGKSQPIMTDMLFGSRADFYSESSPDGSNLKLKIVVGLKEFAGYWRPDVKVGFEPVSQGEGKRSWSCPRFLEQSYEIEEIIPAGKSILLSGLATETQVKGVDEVPGLKDIPMRGRLFRSEPTATQCKALMLIVTPSIVNSYGDKAHTE